MTLEPTFPIVLAPFMCHVGATAPRYGVRMLLFAIEPFLRSSKSFRDLRGQKIGLDAGVLGQRLQIVCTFVRGLLCFKPLLMVSAFSFSRFFGALLQRDGFFAALKLVLHGGSGQSR